MILLYARSRWENSRKPLSILAFGNFGLSNTIGKCLKVPFRCHFRPRGHILNDVVTTRRKRSLSQHHTTNLCGVSKAFNKCLRTFVLVSQWVSTSTLVLIEQLSRPGCGEVVTFRYSPTGYGSRLYEYIIKLHGYYGRDDDIKQRPLYNEG